MNDLATLHERPVELLQQLIRFDTTNPPGNEGECVAYLDRVLRAYGIEPLVLAKDPARPNLLARIPGAGSAPPLLLQGHLDVVTTANQNWQQPPFAGDLAAGMIWGRGALDMKGGVAMMLAACLRAIAEGVNLPGDVLFLALSDEEAGGDFGARFLTEDHPELFQGVRFTIGELGGFTLYFGGRRFYPIQVAEKEMCWMKATFRGAGGHGSLPWRGGAMAQMSRAIQALDQHRLPVHITPAAQLMFETLANGLPAPLDSLIRQLLDPLHTDAALDQMGEEARFFEAILHNTVNPTIIRGGLKVNVIPSEIEVELDMRMLPGFTPEDAKGELRALLGEEVELDVLRATEPCDLPLDMGLFDTLASILREADPDGIPLPLLLPAGTDGRFFQKIGIQPYGFLPMNLPPDIPLLQSIHAADERLPVAALEFGTRALYSLLQRFGEAQ